MMKKVLAVLLVLTMVLCLAACGGEKEPEKEPEKEVKDKFVLVIESEGNDFDPQSSGVAISSSSVIRNVYEPLVRNDADGNIVPALATEWKWDADNMGITFTLRQGVTFSNGEKFTADDVFYSYQERFPGTANGKSESLFDFKNMTKVGENQIHIPLLKLASDALHDFTQSKYSIMNKKAVEAAGDKVGTQPVGTGAYILDKWVQGDRYELKANPNYWGGQPKFKEITVRIIKESTQAQIELESGNVDAVIFNTATNDVLRVLNGEVKGLTSIPIFNGVNVIQFNFTKDPCTNTKLRQALSCAIDRDALAKGDSSNLNTPAYQTPIPGYPSYIDEYNTSKPNGYDLEKAKQLLKEAGYENGLTLECYSDAGALASKDGQLLKNMFAQIGVTLNLHPLESGTFVPTILGGKEADCFLSVPLNDYTGSALQRYRVASDPKYSPDWDCSSKTGTYDDVYKIFAEAEKSLDDAEVKKMLQEMNKIEVEDCKVIPLNTMNIYINAKEGLHVQWRFADPNFFYWYFE